MKQEKLKKYDLIGSIHTMQLKTQDPAVPIQCYIDSGTVETFSRYKDGKTTSLKLNLNNVQDTILDYEKFRHTLQDVLWDMGITDYKLMRVDFRLDNYDIEHYKDFEKLNRYLISLMAVTYDVKNKYRTTDLFSHEQLSVAIKNEYFELENYNRDAKSKQTGNKADPAKSRLEERTKSKGMNFTRTYIQAENELEVILREFTDEWFIRWDKAIKNRDAVQEKYNTELVKIYREGIDSFPVKFRTLTDFLIQYQYCIFTRKQMVDLLTRIGVNNPQKRADRHKQKYGIEYFSKKDIELAIEEIKRSTLFYFSQNTPARG